MVSHDSVRLQRNNLQQLPSRDHVVEWHKSIHLAVEWELVGARGIHLAFQRAGRFGQRFRAPCRKLVWNGGPLATEEEIWCTANFQCFIRGVSIHDPPQPCPVNA